ncbi:MAG: hypothetical protein Q4A56_03850, partial [Porphyromonadaceae bacterium]|nr:hypothetical protein [Porphyromonadaceae bacterium]
MRTKRNVLYFGVILFMLTMLSGCKEPVTPPPVDNTVQVTVKFTFEGTSIKDYTFKSDKNKSYTD